MCPETSGSWPLARAPSSPPPSLLPCCTRSKDPAPVPEGAAPCAAIGPALPRPACLDAFLPEVQEGPRGCGNWGPSPAIKLEETEPCAKAESRKPCASVCTTPRWAPPRLSERSHGRGLQDDNVSPMRRARLPLPREATTERLHTLGASHQLARASHVNATSRPRQERAARYAGDGRRS